jgi:hypothetical protein
LQLPNAKLWTQVSTASTVININEEERSEERVDDIDLLSPKLTSNAGLFLGFPSLSFDESISSQEEEPSSDLSILKSSRGDYHKV